MQPNLLKTEDKNRQPVQPTLAELMDMLGSTQDIDLEWLFHRSDPAPEDV